MRWITQLSVFVLLSATTVFLGCQGLVSGPGSTEGASPSARPTPTVPPGVDPLAHPAGLGPIDARRLSRGELTRVVRDLIGVDATAYVNVLPEDARTPFDNDSSTQFASPALIEGARSFANDAVAAIPQAALESLVGCTPSGPSDRNCLQTFVERVGRRAVRRPLRPAEVEKYLALIRHAEDRNDFWIAPRLVLRAFLQDLELLYRVEVGTPTSTPGIYRLSDYELATRLAFLLWGTMPDDRLLNAAAGGELATPAQVRVEAARMMEDPRAPGQMAHLHALWLGYDIIPVNSAIRTDLRTESDALVQRVLFDDNRPWRDLFTSRETYVTPALAEHYGMPSMTAPGWVTYADGRAGLLSHGSFLSGGTKFGDSSPTMRGKLVFERLLCREIPPPPGTVDTDVVPQGTTPNACKPERYNMTREPDCASCHVLMDPVGFGLEAYGPAGEFRVTEVDKPSCDISGDGELPGLGAFNGPAALAETLVSSGELERCFTRQFFQYAVGRALRPEDERTLGALERSFLEDGDFLGLVLTLVGSDGFRHRVEGN